ncbi:hypothetical protein [Shewanella aestuarii]|uniref:Pili assembly chaperone n=1 Tax=Shewanella aestuarii TaxID=1028752 RepID=A0A6G9QRK4_9GAMM|nr:hypothetical protein [Shewanella aestuarii]QIR16439.1 hypothetical protein HBH39_18375 [Shewanella aestuarii]
MTNVLTLPKKAETNVVLNKKVIGVALVASFLIALLYSMETVAGSGGSAFTTIWTEISGWADGVPGKIITLLAFFAALFNVLKQNYYMAVGAFIGGMLLSQSVTIINVFLTGTI